MYSAPYYARPCLVEPFFEFRGNLIAHVEDDQCDRATLFHMRGSVCRMKSWGLYCDGGRARLWWRSGALARKRAQVVVGIGAS